MVNNDYNYETILPNSKIKVHFRAWTIQDELEYSNNENQLYFLRKLVKNNEILDNLCNAEIHYLIKEIRLVSKMSEIHFNWKCDNKSCGTANQDLPGIFDLEKDIKFVEKSIDNIVIDENLTYYFDNLTFTQSLAFNEKLLNIENEKLNLTKTIFMKIVESVKSIIYKDEIKENMTYEEKYAFISSRPKGELDILIQNFKNTQNIITLSKFCKCPVCNNEKEIMVGIDFFHL